MKSREQANVFSLDDLYHMVSHIYGDKNLNRTATATFAHFVEVCGMLAIHERRKVRESFDVTDALCKALGWYFPLLAKMRVRSVEELIFRKFPSVCPYCRHAPHQDAVCKQVLGTSRTLDHPAVLESYKVNWGSRPKTLNEWQGMFQRIYPRTVEDRNRSVVGLLEEVGELAEAVRVFEAHPKYFMGEAADTFSYLMGIANEHQLRLSQEGIAFSLEDEFIKRYPGLCTQCGSRVCVCPSVPTATVGRMAKEINVSGGADIFVRDPSEFDERGALVAHRVLDAWGGYQGLATTSLPFDRGDANRALVMLCLRLAEAVEATSSQLSESLRVEAYRLAAEAQQPGSPRRPFDLQSLVDQISSAWDKISDQDKSDIKASSDLIGDLGEMLDTVRVLFVYCTPTNRNPIRASSELRAIKESVQVHTNRRVVIEDLPAATVEDLRRKMMSNSYHIVHFAGHSDGQTLTFEDALGQSYPLALSSLGEFISTHESVRCVVLNACSALSHIAAPVGPATIGMSSAVNDNEAIAFSRGFYDALGEGKSIAEAFEEGGRSLALSGVKKDVVRLLVAGKF